MVHDNRISISDPLSPLRNHRHLRIMFTVRRIIIAAILRVRPVIESNPYADRKSSRISHLLFTIDVNRSWNEIGFQSLSRNCTSFGQHYVVSFYTICAQVDQNNLRKLRHNYLYLNTVKHDFRYPFVWM